MSKNCSSCKYLFSNYCPLYLLFEEYKKSYNIEPIIMMIKDNNVVCDTYHKKGGDDD